MKKPFFLYMKIIIRICEYCNRAFNVSSDSEAIYCCREHARRGKVAKLREIGKKADTAKARAACTLESYAKQAASLRRTCKRKKAGIMAWKTRCKQLRNSKTDV
jgi:hypothetical protein